MKGFELTYKNATKYVATEDGVITIYISTLKDESIISVSGIDYIIVSIGTTFFLLQN